MIKIKKPVEKFICPNCEKEIISKNSIDDGIIIKSKLIFLNSNGETYCRCKNCKQVVSLPLIFNKYQNKILDV